RIELCDFSNTHSSESNLVNKINQEVKRIIIILGYKKPLEREDLFELNEGDSSYIVCPIFEKQWRKEVLRTQERQKVKVTIKSLSSFHKEAHTRKPSLLRALWNTFKFALIQVALFKVLADVLSFTSPLIMKQMILFCEQRPDFGWSGYGYALALFVVVFLQTLILQQYQRFKMLTSAKIKTAVIGLIYKKALLLSNVSRKQFSTGEIINLMATDTQQLMDLMTNINLLWSAPFQILMAVSLLWQELGPAVLAGVAVLVFVIPMNALVKNQRKNKDKQIKLLNEILHGIKILKLYAWEPSYKKKIIEIREQELEVQKSAGYLAVFSMLTLTCIPFLVSLATFGVYFLLDEENILTATKVFTSMSLFNILRLPLFDLPMVISAVVQTRISLVHLEDFLNTEELLPHSIEANYIGGYLNIKIPEGALVAVVGQVGSGKSSVLSAILGEMEKLKGIVQRKGSVAYVSQQAWIQNCILQENILFGSVMQKQLYERVLEACALLPDLEQLPNGDQTEIGEKGVNISGGQKHRVCLARAVYSGADIYLLDDPLSAVDVHVAKQLFEKVIGSSGMLRNKTRILVTHNLTLLPQMDLIVVMESGRVAQMGTYQEILAKTKNLTNLLQAFSEQETGEDTIKNKPKIQCVKFSVILKYLHAFGWLWVWLNVATCLGQNLVGTGQNLWLSTWAKEAKHMNDFTEWKQIRSKKLSIYGLLGLMQGLFVCSGAYVVTRGSLAASRVLHAQLLDNVLHLPLQFFETNPIGQVINRFTKVRKPYLIRGPLHMNLASFKLLKKFWLYLQDDLFLSRQIRRLAGASHSPVISHFCETLLGVSTIRAFGHEQRFIQQNKEVVNENLVCFYNNVISNRWLSVRLEFLGNLMVFFTAVLTVLAGNSIDSAIVGLSISYALNITQTLNFWVRKACEIEANAVSIERVCEYETMDKEAPWITSKRPPSQWPSKGIVEFVDYRARYRDDLGLALQDITFQTHGEEKIGIVGRTGAGKSTLSNCLFRIVERSGGKIIIDGIDISTIGLHDLRGKLNIIPQDPVLFSGTLQMNLDPLDKYPDHELWEVLELCHLKEFVQSLPKKLLHEISEGGENLSVGQRQLVCLARALLRKTKILILDEATASIDFETDNLVQTTVRKEFSDCTILTIAHRLHSIIDSDRVLVLDSGRITEFETPQNLIHKRGLFFDMLTEAGITQDLGAKNK
uniref:ATP binding cassette subfamily C member 13 n=1 Tax=Bos taurus TaxID=9913 RepID=A0AAA9RWZ0_BOVIN